jgi:hypothetical protein
MSLRSFFSSTITDANRFATMIIVVAFNQLSFFSLSSSQKSRDESLAFSFHLTLSMRI